MEKVNEFLDEAKVFDFLTVDGDSQKGRPFGFHFWTEASGTFAAAHSRMCTSS